MRKLLCVLVAVGACGHEPETASESSALAVTGEIDLATTELVSPPGLQQLAAFVPRGDGALAVWQDFREDWAALSPAGTPRTMIARVAVDGTVLDPMGIPVGLRWLPSSFGLYAATAACSSATDCLVVGTWSNGMNLQTFGVYRVSGATVLDATPLPLGQTGDYMQAVTLSWDGARYRAFYRGRTGDPLWTQTISAAGVADPLQSLGTPWPDGTGVCRPGGECLITYRHDLSPTSAYAAARTIDASGTLGPELTLSDAVGTHDTGAPIWNGAAFWVPIRGQTQGPASVSRVGAGGAVIDARPILLGASSKVVPSLVADGAVVTAIFGNTTGASASQAYAARIDASGTVLDPGGVPFAASDGVLLGADGPTWIQPLCVPGGCLAAWTQTIFRDDAVRGTRFAGTTELSPGGFEIAMSPAGTSKPGIGFGLGQYLVAWRDSRISTMGSVSAAIRGERLSPAFAPLGTFEVAPSVHELVDRTCPDYDQPAVAASATSFFVAWHEGCNSYDNVYGQVFGPAGAPVTIALEVATEGPSINEANPTVASDGSGFLVAWDRTGNPQTILARRYDAAGNPVGAAFQITGDGQLPLAAFDGTNYIVVWRRRVSNQRDLYAVHVSPAGVVLGPEIVIANAPTTEEGHAVACGSGGGVCAVSWRAPTAKIRAMRIADDGTILDPGGVIVGTMTGTVYATTIAWDGAAYVVGWRTASQLNAARFGATGAVLSVTHPVIASPPSPSTPDEPVMASAGDGNVVLMYDRYDDSSAFRVRRARAIVIADDDGGGGSLPIDAPVSDAAPHGDAAIDAHPDAAIVLPDAHPDAAIDAPVIVPDAAIDAPVVVPDAAIDAAIDAPIVVPDAAIDAPVVPDAPVAVDAAPAIDAAPVADAASASDAGEPHGGGGCDTGGGGGGWLVGVALSVIASRLRDGDPGLFRRRRRG